MAKQVARCVHFDLRVVLRFFSSEHSRGVIPNVIKAFCAGDLITRGFDIIAKRRAARMASVQPSAPPLESKHHRDDAGARMFVKSLFSNGYLFNRCVHQQQRQRPKEYGSNERLATTKV